MSKLREALKDYCGSIPATDEVIERVENDPDLLLGYFGWHDSYNCDVVKHSEITSIAQDMLDESGSAGYWAIYFDQNGDNYSTKIVETKLIKNT